MTFKISALSLSQLLADKSLCSQPHHDKRSIRASLKLYTDLSQKYLPRHKGAPTYLYLPHFKHHKTIPNPLLKAPTPETSAAPFVICSFNWLLMPPTSHLPSHTCVAVSLMGVHQRRDTDHNQLCCWCSVTQLLLLTADSSHSCWCSFVLVALGSLGAWVYQFWHLNPMAEFHTLSILQHCTNTASLCFYIA